MNSLLWSFIERIFPRLSSALVMLLLAVYVQPSTLGLYAVAILGVTFVQAASDAAIRQLAVGAISTLAGRAFILRYQIWSALVGGFSLSLLFLGILLFDSASDDSVRDVVFLMPMIFIPAISASRVASVAKLQSLDRWRSLAMYQFVASVVSLVVSLTVLVLTKSVLAASIQAVFSELIFSIVCRRLAKGSSVELDRVADYPYFREFVHLVQYGIVGWFQGLADRVILGPIAGTAQLGLYSVSASISRSAGDAISTSSTNVLRASIQKKKMSIDEVRRTADSLLVKALGLSVIGVLLTILGSELVLRKFLPEVWDPALDGVRIMAVAAVPMLIAWNLTAVLVVVRRIKWAAPVNLIGILFALPIALAAKDSIVDAAWIVVAREFCMAFLLSVIAGRGAPIRSLVFAFTAMIALLVFGWRFPAV